MGSPCAIRLFAADTTLASTAIHDAVKEIARLEEKYSRFKTGNYFSAINAAATSGGSTSIDAETVSLLNYARACFE